MCSYSSLAFVPFFTPRAACRPPSSACLCLLDTHGKRLQTNAFEQVAPMGIQPGSTIEGDVHVHLVADCLL